MMDYKLQFSDAQAVTSTADSTNIIDLGVAAPDLQPGTPLILHIRVNTAATASGAATVTFSLKQGASSGAATTQIWESSAVAKATLVAGYEIKIPLPTVGSMLQFMKLTYTVATGPLTAGAFDAWLEARS